VLPYVPSDVVRKDLIRTRSVDITISNILEGHIAYVPILPATPTKTPEVQRRPAEDLSSSSSTSAISSSVGSSSSLNTAASSFPKSANERALSFKERKLRLIENARHRYIEKNGLKEIGLSAS
jgi:ancient ubiquitous protein 1